MTRPAENRTSRLRRSTYGTAPKVGSTPRLSMIGTESIDTLGLCEMPGSVLQSSRKGPVRLKGKCNGFSMELRWKPP